MSTKTEKSDEKDRTLDALVLRELHRLGGVGPAILLGVLRADGELARLHPGFAHESEVEASLARLKKRGLVSSTGPRHARVWEAEGAPLGMLPSDPPKPKRVPVDFRYDAINPTFLKWMARIGSYAAEKYGSWEQYREARLTGEKGPVNHIYEHLRSFQEGEPYDHFDGDVRWHLVAVAYNAMMEFFYVTKHGHVKHPLTIDKPTADGFPHHLAGHFPCEGCQVCRPTRPGR